LERGESCILREDIEKKGRPEPGRERGIVRGIKKGKPFSVTERHEDALGLTARKPIGVRSKTKKGDELSIKKRENRNKKGEPRRGPEPGRASARADHNALGEIGQERKKKRWNKKTRSILLERGRHSLRVRSTEGGGTLKEEEEKGLGKGGDPVQTAMTEKNHSEECHSDRKTGRANKKKTAAQQAKPAVLQKQRTGERRKTGETLNSPKNAKNHEGRTRLGKRNLMPKK